MSNFDEQGRHFGSIQDLEYCGDWIDGSFPFSKKDKWERYGILGVLGDMFLRALPDTHVLEIGTGESSIYLSQACRRNNRNFYTCDIALGKISNPLSVPGYILEGVSLMTQGSTSSNSQHPFRGLAYVGSSDDFFKDERVKLPKIGVAFIDGDHNYEQVKKDYENTLAVLADDGVIFFHDVYPPSEDYISENKCGDVYRLRQELEKDPRVDYFTFTKLVAVDVGLGMARKKKIERPYYNE